MVWVWTLHNNFQKGCFFERLCFIMQKIPQVCLAPQDEYWNLGRNVLPPARSSSARNLSARRNNHSMSAQICLDNCYLVPLLASLLSLLHLWWHHLKVFQSLRHVENSKWEHEYVKLLDSEFSYLVNGTTCFWCEFTWYQYFFKHLAVYQLTVATIPRWRIRSPC